VPPLPPDLMAGVYREYERRKEQARTIDHEDQLELAIRTFEADKAKLEVFRDRYRAFTVDEYQDVNLLQQTLLELWVGDRDDVCVVGDDYQSIYGFTGATPRYLLDFPKRYPQATVVRLEENYRSTPQILSVANRLAPSLGGTRKNLRPVNRPGPRPVIRSLESAEHEAAFVADRVLDLRRRGIPLREIAVLYRVRHRSPLYEEALLEADLPFQVREGAFLERAAARTLLPRLAPRGNDVAVAGVVEEEARRAGYLDLPPLDLGPAELTRQNDMARLILIAREFEGDGRRVADFLVHLRERFESESERDAVQLMTYHSAKGLEFEAVFLPQVEEREIPYWRALEDEDKLAEERRLFYVGLTRAKRELCVTWSHGRGRSRFLEELLAAPARPPLPSRGRPERVKRERRRGRGRSSGGSKSPGLAPGSWRPDWLREQEE
jgi:DNA helicase-2/ATP-dependent DNA helicase PcrA